MKALFVLIATLGVWTTAPVAHANIRPCEDTLAPANGRSARGKKNSINSGVKSEVRRNSFVVGRNLTSYIWSLHGYFIDDLMKLGPDDILLDGGAGRANAMLEYLYAPDLEFKGYGSSVYKYGDRIVLPPLDRRASVVAAGFKRPAQDRSEDSEYLENSVGDPRFRYVKGDINDMPERHPELLGRVSMIVDVYGAMKYSHLQKTLETYLALLKVGGKLYFRSPNAQIFLNGVQVPVTQFFSRIEGVKLTYKPSENYPTNPIATADHGDFILEKTGDAVKVPALEFFRAEMDPDSGGVGNYLMSID